MTIVIAYLSTAAVFLALDIVGLRYLIFPVFDRHVGHLLAQPPRFGAATVFYLAYVAGVLWFVSLPALRNGAPVEAFIGGVLLGLMCYGTYEFTNYATLSDWTLEQVVVDSAWGAVLTGSSAWIGVQITQRLM